MPQQFFDRCPWLEEIQLSKCQRLGVMLISLNVICHRSRCIQIREGGIPCRALLADGRLSFSWSFDRSRNTAVPFQRYTIFAHCFCPNAAEATRPTLITLLSASLASSTSLMGSQHYNMVGTGDLTVGQRGLQARCVSTAQKKI